MLTLADGAVGRAPSFASQRAPSFDSQRAPSFGTQPKLRASPRREASVRSGGTDYPHGGGGRAPSFGCSPRREAGPPHHHEDGVGAGGTDSPRGAGGKTQRREALFADPLPALVATAASLAPVRLFVFTSEVPL